MENTKKCPECGEPIRGRSDKKYCSDLCRTAYNNKLNSDRNNYIRRVNSILRKNRMIMEKLNPNGKIKLHRRELERKGFNFQYFTNVYRTKKGNTYYFCYEQGYLPLENNYLALVKRQDNKR